jgi:hypothetical protein
VPPTSDTQNLRLPFNPHPWTIDLGFKFSPNGNWIFSRGYDSADRYIVMLMDLRKDGEAWLLEEKKALFSDILFSANEDAILLAEYTERSGILYDLTLPVAERKATNIDSLSFLYEMQIDGVNGYRSLSADAPGWFYSPNNYRMSRTKWVNRIDGVGLKPANSGNIAVTYK